MTPRSIAPPAASSEGKQGRSRIVGRGRVHRHDPAGEPAGDQVGEDVVPDFSRGAGGADDGDGAGCQQRVERHDGGGLRLAAAPSRGRRRAAPRAPRGCCRSARGRRSSRGRRPARPPVRPHEAGAGDPAGVERRGDARHQVGPAVVEHLDQRGAGAADPEEPAVGAEDVAHRDDADEPAVVIDDGKRPDAVAIEEQQRVVQRRIARQGDRGAAHDGSTRTCPRRSSWSWRTAG